MKRILKTLTITAAMAAALSACNREKMALEPNDGMSGLTGDELGYITFAGGGITVEWNGENVNTPAGSEDFPEAASTRAAVTDDFTLEIYRTAPDAGELLLSATVGEFNALYTEDNPYGLPVTRGGKPCRYRIDARSSDAMADTAWDDTPGQPTYSGQSQEFGVETRHTADNPLVLEPVKCKLESIKMSVAMEKNMAELGRDIVITASIHSVRGSATETSPKLVFEDGRDGADNHHFGVVYLTEDSQHAIDKSRGNNGFEIESSCGYFKPIADDNAITLHVSMNYTDTYEGDTPQIMQDVAICTRNNPAHANEYRRVLLYITHGDEDDQGGLIIRAVVETWTYGKEVDVDVVEQVVRGVGESTIPDIDNRNAPRITSPDFSLADRNSFDASSYNTAGIYQSGAVVNIETVNPVAGFAVRFSTDNTLLNTLYNRFGIADRYVDMMNDTQSGAHTYVQTLGIPSKSDIEGKTSLAVDIRSWLNSLYMYGGEHSLRFEITDSEGNSSTAEIALFYDSENGQAGETLAAPVIEWEGYDIDRRYEVTPDLTVKVNVTAKAGIQSLKVRITGELAGDLDSVGLVDEFDLIDPEQAKPGLSSSLGDLGFPVGDQVRDKTEVSFDITDFMALLGTFHGDNNFELTVTDNSGQTTVKTIQLLVP